MPTTKITLVRSGEGDAHAARSATGGGQHPRRVLVEQVGGGSAAVVVSGDDLVVWVPDKLIRLYQLPGPVAVTDEVWDDVVTWPTAQRAGRMGRRMDSEEERLFNLLFMLVVVRQTSPVAARRGFTVWRVPPGSSAAHRHPVRLAANAAVNSRSDAVTLVNYARPDRAGMRGWLHYCGGAR